MATNMYKGKNDSYLLLRLLRCLGSPAATPNRTSIEGGFRSVHDFKKRLWYIETGTPSVDAADYAAYPMQQGDFVVDLKNDDVYVVKTAPASGVAGVFTEITTGM